METYSLDQDLNCFINGSLNRDEPQYGSAYNDTNALMITIFGVCLTCNVKSALELGVRHGCTTRPILHACALTGGHLDSVDKRSAKHVRFKPDNQQKNHWKLHQSDSLQFLEKLPKNKIYDIIYIDDDHSYDHVKKELKLIEPHVNKQSLILLHDLMNGTFPDYKELNKPSWQVGKKLKWGYPTKAVMELDKIKWEFVTIPFSHGLTILRRLY